MARPLSLPALLLPRSPALATTQAAAEVADAPQAAPPTLDALFRRYSSYVAAIALSLLGRDSEVDDVVQDAFAAALTDLPRLRSHAPAAVKGWLGTITVRICYRRLRKRRLWSLLGLDHAPPYEDIVAASVSPEDRLLLAQIYAALDDVDPQARVAWLLRYVQDEPLESAARLCGCSLATLKRRIQAVNQRLQGLIHDDA